MQVIHRKSRDFSHRLFDTRIWDSFSPKEGDIVIDSYSKAGTTWLQQIVSQLVFNASAPAPVNELSPWVDVQYADTDKMFKMLEAQQHRRFLKTHAPADTLTLYSGMKYLYTVRDGRDVAWSYHNHFMNAKDEYFDLINGVDNGLPPLPRLPKDPKEFFLRWMREDGYPFGPFWGHVRGWWELRALPNIFLLHFQNLKDDLPGMIRRIAAFLEIDIDESKFTEIVEHCSFEYMHANAGDFTRRRGSLLFGGAQTFVYKGTNGRWQGLLTPEESAEYEAMAVSELGEECARWLRAGRRA